MSSVAEIPLIDTPPDGGGEPTKVTFTTQPATRRGFLRTATLGAMTLGLTGLSWIPLSRPAAAVLTEYTGCAGYGDWPGYANNSKRCVGAPYSRSYCKNKWFKDGCFRIDDHTVCFRPRKICGDDGRASRNAWRWTHNGYRWRCADGEIKPHAGSPWTLKICSARLRRV